MDELDKLRQEIEILKNRMTYLEETLATIADMSKSGEMGQYITERQRALAASKLVNAAAGTQKLNADAQQQAIDKLAAEKAAMDARIEEAIRASAQNTPAEDDLAEQFTYRNVTGGVEVQAFDGFETEGEFIIPTKIRGRFVVRIGANAFKNMNFSKVILPQYVECIEENAFQNCCNLEDIVCPDSLQIIGNGAFRYCKKLRQVVLPEELQKLGEFSFAETAVQNIKIPKTIKKLSVGCFSNCSQLKKIYLEDGLEKIERFSLSDTRITKIVIPQSVQSIDNESFVWRERRTMSIAILGRGTQIEGIPYNATIYCVAGSEAQKIARLNGSAVKPLSEFEFEQITTPPVQKESGLSDRTRRALGL